MKKNYPKFSLLIAISVALVSFLLILIFELLTIVFNLDNTIKLLVSILISICIGLIVTYGLSVFLPTFSDAIVTLRRLLRFESLSHPLLLRLSYEAPGTFHHSINVSILAQKAAKSIGADALLVRVAAYYHDLGKLENPIQFIENQSGAEIPQTEDAESIRKAAKSIILHVKKGVETAQKNFLPENIVNLIAEHHGTTKVLYFYEKAKEKGLKIKQTDFKYEGPAPQSKEAGILMIADSCEAAARAVPDLTRGKISEIVENAILDKIKDNQLKSTGLSESELALIKNSLLETLCSIYHQRIIEKRHES
jgi:putative nucleotidyltransferase with HDIG domain